MDSAARPSPPRRLWAIDPLRLARILTVLLVVAYASALGLRMGAWAGGSDSSGYLNHARLIREGRLRPAQITPPHVPRSLTANFTFVPLGFKPTPRQTMVPTYPCGLPLMIAALSFVVGLDAAPHVVLWLHALAGIGLVYWLGRLAGLPRPWAGLAAALLAFSPLYVMMSLNAMSDVPALVWCTLAVTLAWRARTGSGWAVGAGLAVGMAVLVRPADLLVMLPVGILLGLDWRRWLGLGVGGIPAAVFQLILNHHLYDGYLHSGYGPVGNLFASANLLPSLANYATTLPVVLTPAVFLCILFPWFSGLGRSRAAWALAVWTLIFGGFYAFYYYTHETWWYLRFVLPAFPPALVGVVLVLRQLLARIERHRVWLGLGIALGLLGWLHHYGDRHSVWSTGDMEREYPQAAAWARDHLPADALIACMQVSGSFRYYTDFVLFRWDAISPENVSVLTRIARREHRPIYAALFPFETEPALHTKVPGDWTQIGKVQQVTFWRRDEPPAPRPPQPVP